MRNILVLVITVCISSACSFFKSDNRYLDSASTNPLEAPPDMVTPDWEQSLEIPKTANDRISALETQGPALGASVLPEFLDIRVRKEGLTKWLEVNTDPVTLWPYLRQFWLGEGYDLAADEPLSGYMETGWKQNLDQSKTVETGQESFDVTGEKFRTRLERQPDSTTYIFITHRGAEVAAINQDNQILWKPQPPNGEREAVMMIRMMEYLGASLEEAQEKFAATDNQYLYIDIRDIGGVPILVVGDNFSRVWRRTGVALDRSGLVVEDHNRSKGVYFVTLDQASNTIGDQPTEVNIEKSFYEVHLLGKGEQTIVTVHPMSQEEGMLDPELARQLLKRIVSAYPGSYPNA